MQPNEIYILTFQKKMYLKKKIFIIVVIKLLFLIFLFSLIKKMRRPGRVQVERLSKNKFFFELSVSLIQVLGLREHYCLRPAARTSYTLVLICSLPLFQFQLTECFLILLFSLLNSLTLVLLKCH